MRFLLLIGFIFSGIASSYSQEDLLSLLDEEEVTDYTIASFKTNRVINLHSLENTAKGVFDFKISHRFGFVSGGVQELFGLDQSMVRIGGDYGITDRLMVGFGRSSLEKTYDVFAKFKILRQSSGKKTMPFTMSLLHTSAIKTKPFEIPERENHFSSRMFYTWQLILGRKFSDRLSLQISPTVVHRNLVEHTTDYNDVYALAGAGRFKISKRLALNAEYIYVYPDHQNEVNTNSLSLGIDLETGGHVFQLHFTNSTSMIEKGFVTESTGSWMDGDVHFGFNVSRVFTIN